MRLTPVTTTSIVVVRGSSNMPTSNLKAPMVNQFIGSPTKVRVPFMVRSINVRIDITKDAPIDRIAMGPAIADA